MSCNLRCSTVMEKCYVICESCRIQILTPTVYCHPPSAYIYVSKSIDTAGNVLYYFSSPVQALMILFGCLHALICLAIAEKVFPLCSKLRNSSKLAQPGLSRMASPVIHQSDNKLSSNLIHFSNIFKI